MDIKRKPRYILHVNNTESNLEKSNSIVTVIELGEIYRKNNGRAIDKYNIWFATEKERDNVYDEFVKRGFHCEKHEADYADDMIAHWVVKQDGNDPDGFPRYHSECSECGESSSFYKFCPRCHRYMCDEPDLHEVYEGFRDIYKKKYSKYMND